MHNQDFQELIKKQQKDKLSPEEQSLLEKFENELITRNKNIIFRSESHRETIKLSVERKIKKALFLYSKSINKKPLYRWGIAASITFLLMIGGYYFIEEVQLLNNENRQENILLISKETSYGQKKNITLPDGSKVSLNSGTKITFPEHFNDSIRQVELTGEAYFDVVHNPEVPFVVKSLELRTKVLGTTFNVEAYDSSNPIKVTLESGLVELSTVNTLEITKLIPSEQGIFDRQSRDIEVQEANVNEFLEWKDGIIRFDNSSFEEIESDLEKWFGVSITFENEELFKCTFTGKFDNVPINTILESIQYSSQEKIYYEYLNDEEIIIKGKCIN